MNDRTVYTLLKQFLFLATMAWGLCVVGLGYVLFGDVMQDFGTRSVLVPIDQQGSGRSSVQLEERIEKGIHVATGLKVGKGFDIVRQTCTGCHSAKLITQNRATRQGWKDMISWMQETQGLWELGPIENEVLDYLSTYYAPEEQGRRAPLATEDIEWYWLED